jgi:predicted ATPase
MPELPSGTVTFLFTDVEGSTKLLHELGAEGYAEALAEHRRLIREACNAHDGVEVDTQGDAFFFAFPTAPGAIGAASDMTERLALGPIRVRIGLHTGTPLLTDEGYVGDDVHFAARVASSGHGGQVILSATTTELVELELSDLGEHRLKDIPQPVPIYQLGSERFPPLRTISNTNLPRPASSFVGRDRETAEVLSLLKGDARLVTLTGPGGSGKTRLAIEAASELVPDLKAGVFWVGLAALRDPALVTGAVAQTLGAKDGLAEHISERELLLLLDNLEQVIEAAPELADLLEACPNLGLLVTSRELLRVRGEVEYAVPPLTDPEAVELFCARAQLDADATIGELCRRLDSLPLAVELAAARTSVLAPAQVLVRISQRLDLLKGGRDAEARQQTLRATIEWSYELLSPEEQQLFARLSVFAGGCMLEAAEDVCDADIDTLQSLVEKSLVRFTTGRYWMLETIREYAGERLAGLGEGDELMERLAHHLVELAYVHGAPRFRERSAEAHNRLELEHANVRMLMDWAHRRERPREAAEVVAAWAMVWIARGHSTEASGWIPLALRARGKVSDYLWTIVLLNCETILVFVPGDFTQARALMEEALDVTRRLEDEEWLEAAVLSELSAISRHEGRLDESRDWAERSLDLRVAHGLETVRSLADLGSLALAEGDLDRAEALLVEVRDICARDGPARYVAVASRHLGEVERRRGNMDMAIGHVADALRGFAQIGEEGGAGACLEDLARIAKARDELERAARLWAMGQALRTAGGYLDRNPLFPDDIGELPDLSSDVQIDVGLEEAVRLALTDID